MFFLQFPNINWLLVIAIACCSNELVGFSIDLPLIGIDCHCVALTRIAVLYCWLRDGAVTGSRAMEESARLIACEWLCDEYLCVWWLLFVWHEQRLLEPLRGMLIHNLISINFIFRMEFTVAFCHSVVANQNRKGIYQKNFHLNVRPKALLCSMKWRF